ncbi:membrane-associated protein [Lachnospiraceae bacterium KM106-2]|nr:membrane-associated protein [Lachnospiraceae bacterium KM106-2]
MGCFNNGCNGCGNGCGCGNRCGNGNGCGCGNRCGNGNGCGCGNGCGNGNGCGRGRGRDDDDCDRRRRRDRWDDDDDDFGHGRRRGGFGREGFDREGFGPNSTGFVRPCPPPRPYPPCPPPRPYPPYPPYPPIPPRPFPPAPGPGPVITTAYANYNISSTAFTLGEVLPLTQSFASQGGFPVTSNTITLPQGYVFEVNYIVQGVNVGTGVDFGVVPIINGATRTFYASYASNDTTGAATISASGSFLIDTTSGAVTLALGTTTTETTAPTINVTGTLNINQVTSTSNRRRTNI